MALWLHRSPSAPPAVRDPIADMALPQLSRFVAWPVLALASMAAASIPASARAAPPSGEHFQITYFTTDAEGRVRDRMTVQDLQNYVNRARCECGQLIDAEIRINAQNTGGPLDNVQVRTFVGNRCNEAQNLANPQGVTPCVLALDGFTNLYTQGQPPHIQFVPIFLGYGIERGGPQGLADATSSGSCQTGQGDGGVWICVENGAQTDCQPEEFVVNGTQNTNVPEGEEQRGFRFDFMPPTVTVTDFEAEGGDGSLLVRWKQTSTADVQGFRVLCADDNGNPLPGHGFRPSGPNYGQFYYTTQNVCPDGPFNDPRESSNPILPTDPGVDTGDDPGTTGDDPGTTGEDPGTTGAGLDGSGDVDRFESPRDPQANHDCCTASTMSEPGCPDASCEFSVCNSAPSCCDDVWDQGCADLALDLCVGCGGAGDCCLANASASCYDSACAQQVCADDPSCCSFQWAPSCAEAANELCSVCMDDSTSTGTGDPSGGTEGSDTTGTGTDGGSETTGPAPLPSSGIESLDWAYVCTGHLPLTATQARITGLENGRTYQVLVIAYDQAGNPTAASEVLTAVPRETTDLWEQCRIQGDICGDGGFCSCTTEAPKPLGALGMTLGGLLGLAGVWRRRRRRR
jgi:MYXO-CTERM domain-containing protein